MKDRPLMPEQYRITSVSKLSTNAYSIKVSGKLPCMPGQYVFASLSGIGECPVFIASRKGGSLELIFSSDDSVTKALSKQVKGDKIGIRDPYGKALPIKEMSRKDIYLIGESAGISALKHLLEHLSNNRIARTISMYAYFDNAEEVFNNLVADWEKEYPVIVAVRSAEEGEGLRVCEPQEMLEGIRKENSVAVISVEDPMPICRTLLDSGMKEKQIFVAAKRTMVCGMGKCGHCLHNGLYVCKEGPFMRFQSYMALEAR